MNTLKFLYQQRPCHPVQQLCQGLGVVPCRYYAWQRRGQPPGELPAVRRSGGHSVLGFWQAPAPGQPLQAYVRAGALKADLFVLAVTDFAQFLGRLIVLVLDNASIHRAHVVRACHAEWAANGIILLFLPELNHIELPWHRCKHYRVRSEDYQPDHTLLQRIAYVLNRTGPISKL